jgi:hypothetical protein
VKAACGKPARAVWAADGGQREGNPARLLRPDKNQEAFKKLHEGFHRSPPQKVWLDTKIICPGGRWNQPAFGWGLRSLRLGGLARD